MMGHFNQLTPAQQERLAILAEEMGESLQVIGKILRHGYESSNPLQPTSSVNRMLLENELGDVQASIQLLTSSGDLSPKMIDSAKQDKLERLKRWTHHQVFPS